ncbi:putative silencing suppressor [Grapevine polerovirus 1]|nr:putative silencing suppressor [Grapevine polerovirus 1]
MNLLYHEDNGYCFPSVSGTWTYKERVRGFVELILHLRWFIDEVVAFEVGDVDEDVIIRSLVFFCPIIASPECHFSSRRGGRIDIPARLAPACLEWAVRMGIFPYAAYTPGCKWLRLYTGRLRTTEAAYRLLLQRASTCAFAQSLVAVQEPIVCGSGNFIQLVGCWLVSLDRRLQSVDRIDIDYDHCRLVFSNYGILYRDLLDNMELPDSDFTDVLAGCHYLLHLQGNTVDIWRAFLANAAIHVCAYTENPFML